MHKTITVIQRTRYIKNGVITDLESLFTDDNFETLSTDGKIKYRFIGYNPMPVKGYFDSSFLVLNKWLLDNGFERKSEFPKVIKIVQSI